MVSVYWQSIFWRYGCAKGTPTQPGVDGPLETVLLKKILTFWRMKNGDFPEGSHVLRAKIDTWTTNMLMRDPLMYRVLHRHHHRTGNELVLSHVWFCTWRKWLYRANFAFYLYIRICNASWIIQLVLWPNLWWTIKTTSIWICSFEP
jgi:hypothetical protein